MECHHWVLHNFVVPIREIEAYSMLINVPTIHTDSNIWLGQKMQYEKSNNINA